MIIYGIDAIRSDMRHRFNEMTFKESDGFRSFMNVVSVVYYDLNVGSVPGETVKFLVDQLAKAYEDVKKLKTKQEKLDATNALARKVFGALAIKNECEFEKMKMRNAEKMQERPPKQGRVVFFSGGHNYTF